MERNPMWRLSSVGLLALGMGLVAGAGGSALAAVKEPPVEGSQASQQQLSGTVASVSEQKKTLTVKEAASPNKTTEISVDTKTAISKGSQQLNLGDLKPGDAVSVDCIRQQGKTIARSIAVMPQGAATGGGVPMEGR